MPTKTAVKKWMCECGEGPFKNEHGLNTHMAKSAAHVKGLRISTDPARSGARVKQMLGQWSLTSDDRLALDALREFLNNGEPQDAIEELVVKSASSVLKRLLLS